MGLEFIYGPASCQHEHPLVEKAAQWLEQDEHHEVFYLVPNHVKFETEVSVLQNLHRLPRYETWENMSTMRLQVFSFTRLAWYYLQNTAAYQDQQLSDAGVHMVIRKILQQEVENLHVFRGEINHPGFVAQLADLFSELQAGQIAGEDLDDLVANLGTSLKEVDFKRKLIEFQLLYEAYLSAISQHQVGPSQMLTHLSEYLKTADLGKVMFVVTGFSRFNAIEQSLIQTLIEYAAEVKLNLVLDQAYVQSPPDLLSMFYDTGKLYFEMYQFARHQQIKIYQDKRLSLVSETPLGKLDEVWQASQKLSPAVKPVSLGSDQVQIWEGATPFTEVSHVAREIRHLVATTDIRYKDIEILTRDLSYYQHLIGPVFQSYELPYYLNQELEMKHHPLVEYLTTLFAIKERNFRYVDVMRFLRTELFLPSQDLKGADLATWEQVRDDYRHAVDVTENVVLAYGYEGFYWTQEKDWQYIYYDFIEEKEDVDDNLKIQKRSNEVRRDLRDALLPFYQQLAQAKTGREAASCIYQFLLEQKVDQQLLFWRNQGIEAGDLEGAKIHEQTWQAFMQLLDEYVEILGEAPFDLAEFIELLSTGLDGLTYSKVPTTIDQLTVSSLDLIHAQKNRVTFILGATDQVLPQKIENKTLLSDEERGIVAENLSEEKYLNKNTTRDLGKEPFIFYLAFTSTKERLYLTYPCSSEQSSDSKLSPYVSRLSQLLEIPIQRKNDLPEDFSLSLGDIGTYRTLITDLNALKRLGQERGELIAPLWLRLEEHLLKHPTYGTLAQQTLSSLNHKNTPETLTPTVVDDLYGETIYGSVSKIENFYQCQYKYFMTYGLKLKEREKFELSPAAAGDFYHDALDQLFKALIERNLSLSELSSQELKEVTERVLHGLLEENKFAILNASQRMNYIRYQLSQTIQQVGWALKKQSQRTGLSTEQTEVIFGQIAQTKGLDSLDFNLGNKKKLKVRGKIDRLDSFAVEGQEYLAIVDYKSSRHTFDYREAYFGLAMQMVTYIDVALKNAVTLVGQKDAQAAGAFYLQIKNPTLEGIMAPEAVEEEFLKEYRYQGLIVEQPEALDKLDQTLDEQPRSSIFPYYQKKNGDYGSSHFISQDDLNLLRKQNERNFKQAGEDIFAGETKLNPAYRDKTRVACQFCPFRSVCQFDVMLKENEYKRLDRLDKKDVLNKIREQKEDNANE